MKQDLSSVNHCCCHTQREAEGECSQGVNSQGGLHMKSGRTELKNKNLLLYKMQAPSAALLLLQTLQFLEMVMRKD